LPSKVVFKNTLAVSSIGEEYTLCEFPIMDNDYVVIGLLDIGSMETEDVIEVSLYVAVDGFNTRRVYVNPYSYTTQEKIIYIRPFVSPKDGRLKITLKQTNGTPKSFPYWIAGFVLYDEVASWILKLLTRDIA